MKNLKRALSLVLSAAMMVGMMVVGTSAAYADVKAEHNAEAIAMMQAAGIMTGDDKGNFNPDAKITRNEMAVVMANMLGLDTDDFAGASSFADVPAWAKAYVDACYANGIVSGVSATQYNGSANVTTREAALMMLKALGYFQYAGDFENDWSLATIKQASKIDLLDGIDAGAQTAMTRNEVAQLALNALESIVVDAEGGNATTTNITAGDVKIEVTGKATYVKQTNNWNYGHALVAVGNESVNYEYLIEKLYDEDFKKSSQDTDLLQPGHVWKDMTQKTEDQEIIAVAKSPKYTLVVSHTGLNTALDVYKKYVDKKADNSIFASESYAKVTDSNWTGTGYTIGDVVEMYTNSDGKIVDVVVLDYSIGTVTKIDTKTLTNADKEADGTAKVSVKTGNNTIIALDSRFAGFDYEKDDVILYIAKVIDGKQHVIASQLAESVEGKVATTKSNKATINGTSYIFDVNEVYAKNVSLKEEGTFYLGMANEILYKDTVAASEDYIYIYNMKVENKLNSDGIYGYVATAYTVDAEGTKAVYDVAVKADNGKLYFKDTAVEIDTTNGWTGVMAYSVNDDGKLVRETAKYDPQFVNNMSIDKDGANGATSATEFVFVYTDGSAKKVATKTGYKDVKIATGTPMYTITNSDSKITLVFVAAKNGTITSDAALAVVLDATAVKGKNADDKNTFTYTVAIDGVESELTFETEQSFTKGAVFAYIFEGDWAKIDSTADYFGKNGAEQVQVANDDYIKVGNVQYNLTGDETIYTIVKEYKNNAIAPENLDTVSVVAGGEIEANDKVYYTVDDDAIETIFVIEELY